MNVVDLLCLTTVWRPQDSSGLRVHYSQEEGGPAPGQRTVLVSGAGTRVSCAARLVAASLHSHGGREADMRLVADGSVLVSGYTADYQPARRLVPAPALAADSSLQLLCSSGDCFALLTWDTACISRGRPRSSLYSPDSDYVAFITDAEVKPFIQEFFGEAVTTDETTMESKSTPASRFITAELAITSKTTSVPTSPVTTSPVTTSSVTTSLTAVTNVTKPHTTTSFISTSKSTFKTAVSKSETTATSTTITTSHVKTSTIVTTSTDRKEENTTLPSDKSTKLFEIVNQVDSGNSGAGAAEVTRKNSSLLAVAPRSLDDEYDELYAENRENVNGDINFSNVYRNASKQLYSSVTVILSPLSLYFAALVFGKLSE